MFLGRVDIDKGGLIIAEQFDQRFAEVVVFHRGHGFGLLDGGDVFSRVANHNVFEFRGHGKLLVFQGF